MYADILNRRLEKGIKEKRIIPENQTGFRKGMCTMKNIYVLNYLISRETAKAGKIITCSLDIKAAFDAIDRSRF